jgi:predicted nucleic acid-binding protein
MFPLVYLDYNCFQRSFDDPGQLRIQMEALACEEVFRLAEAGHIRLIWSFMHHDETVLCPFPERQVEVAHLAELCAMRIGPEESIRAQAHEFARLGNLRPKDALHLAAAVFAEAGFFLTCDDLLLKRSSRMTIGPMVLNPVEFVSRRLHEPSAQNP